MWKSSSSGGVWRQLASKYKTSDEDVAGAPRFEIFGSEIRIKTTILFEEFLSFQSHGKQIESHLDAILNKVGLNNETLKISTNYLIFAGTMRVILFDFLCSDSFNVDLRPTHGLMKTCVTACKSLKHLIKAQILCSETSQARSHCNGDGPHP